MRQVVVDNDGDDGAWNFDASISIEEGSHENGQVHCLVNKEILGNSLVSCLNAAERNANAAIMACITPFEEHCKKVIKMEDMKVKLSEVKHLVTEDFMEEIHITLRRRFSSELVSKVRELWGHVLEDVFIEQSLKPMISKLILHANKCFRLNDGVFLEISEARTALFTEPIDPAGVLLESLQHESAAAKVVNVVKSTTDITLPSIDHIVKVKEATSFALGFHTSCHGVGIGQDSVETTMREFFSIFFHLLQDCRSHEMDERHQCRDFAAKKLGSDLPKCQKMSQDVWNNFSRSAKILRDTYTENIRGHEHPSFERHLTNLKLDTAIHGAAKLADTTSQYAHNSYGDSESELFCYNIPESYRRGEGVDVGGCFHHSVNGEEDTAPWHGVVTDITCTAVDPKEAGVCAEGDDVMLGDFLIRNGDAPKLHEMDLSVRLECDLDAWNASSNVVGSQGSFLGFKMYSVIRLVFIFNNGKPEHSFTHPVTGYYKHSFIAVITSLVTVCTLPGERGHVRNLACVGPRHSSFQVILNDEVQQVSGYNCSVQDLIQSFMKSRKPNFTKLSRCYVMPVDNISLREDILRFHGIARSKRLPKSIMLSLLDPHMADAYDEERRLMHYRALRASKSQNKLEQLRFQALSDLEHYNREEIKQAALRGDKLMERRTIVHHLFCSVRVENGRGPEPGNIFGWCWTRAENISSKPCHYTFLFSKMVGFSFMLYPRPTRNWKDKDALCFNRGSLGTLGGSTKNISGM